MLMLPKQWLARWQGKDIFAQIFSLPGESYREQPGRKTFRYEDAGHYYFIKLHYGVGWREIFKNLLQGRLPVLGAKNEWRAISRLHALGFTAPIIGYGWRGRNPATQQSFIITSALPYTINLEEFCQDWKKTKPPYALITGLIHTVADIARNMHGHGVNHRDFYLCHFLLDITGGPDLLCSNDLNIYLIDLHRAQVRSKVPYRWRVKDIAGLYFSAMDINLTRRDLYRFIKYYSQRPLRTILMHDKSFWQDVEQRAIALYKKSFGHTPELPRIKS